MDQIVWGLLGTTINLPPLDYIRGAGNKIIRYLLLFAPGYPWSRDNYHGVISCRTGCKRGIKIIGPKTLKGRLFTSNAPSIHVPKYPGHSSKDNGNIFNRSQCSFQLPKPFGIDRATGPCNGNYNSFTHASIFRRWFYLIYHPYIDHLPSRL